LFVAYSLASIRERVNNLRLIIPVIIRQCDRLYVNLVGHNQFPDELINNNIEVYEKQMTGSQVRFLDYHKDRDYYFTIDDDILYPDNYTEYMLSKMNQYQNKAICCVHGSNIDLTKKKDYYKKKFTSIFHNELTQDKLVMFPGVGTSCFYKGKLELKSMDIDNISDVYVGLFAAQQRLSIICVSRKEGWLKRLDEFGKTIWKHNNHKAIDEIINRNKFLWAIKK